MNNLLLTTTLKSTVVMWLSSLATNRKPVQSQGKIELSFKNAFASRFLTNLLKSKISGPIRLIKV